MHTGGLDRRVAQVTSGKVPGTRGWPWWSGDTNPCGLGEAKTVSGAGTLMGSRDTVPSPARSPSGTAHPRPCLPPTYRGYDRRARHRSHHGDARFRGFAGALFRLSAARAPRPPHPPPPGAPPLPPPPRAGASGPGHRSASDAGPPLPADPRGILRGNWVQRTAREQAPPSAWNSPGAEGRAGWPRAPSPSPAAQFSRGPTHWPDHGPAPPKTEVKSHQQKGSP